MSKEIEIFEEKRSQMNQEPLDADAGIGAAMNALPEMTEKKRYIDMHTNIATALLAEIQSRSKVAGVRKVKDRVDVFKPQNESIKIRE